ncbi:unnamed protein product [Dibothriocephalus latus]|uniref:Uncharacterized protein n=1 Tax=Dibothriocephalus latus TaxID=60516 RepID=A0A3P7LU05_DIBLA|nr:unnamed protein product [Dibothriocephalus latus]
MSTGRNPARQPKALFFDWLDRTKVDTGVGGECLMRQFAPGRRQAEKCIRRNEKTNIVLASIAFSPALHGGHGPFIHDHMFDVSPPSTNVSINLVKTDATTLIREVMSTSTLTITALLPEMWIGS